MCSSGVWVAADPSARLRQARPLALKTFASVPAPDIVAVQRTADGGIRFVWGTVPGITYRVEAAAAVAGGSWLILAEEVASGETMTHTDRPAAGPRFYRVMIP